MTKQINLTENLAKLNEIANWFEEQENADVEEGLSKVKIATELIKESKQRLKEIENEFAEIQASVADQTGNNNVNQSNLVMEVSSIDEESPDPDNIPF